MVIAVVSVAVATTFGRSTDRHARLEINRFMAVVNEVRDEAVIAGEAFALEVDKKGRIYRFVRTRAGASATTEDNLLKTRAIRDDIDMDWEVYDVIEPEEGTKPRVLISSLGEITPFELTLSGDEHDYIVFVNDEGVLERRDRRAAFR